MKTVEKKIIFITTLGHALCHIYMLILAGVLIPISQGLGISLIHITQIGTLSYFLFGVGALPSGILATKTNAKLTLKLFFLFSSLAAILTGVSHTITSFTVGLGLIGLSGSLYHVSGLTLISQGLVKKGKSLGIHGVAGSAGITLTPFLSSLILTTLDWKAIYLIMAIPGFLGFLFLCIDQEIPSAHVQVETHSMQIRPQGHKLRMFVLALVAMAINGFIYRGFLTILPTYIAEKVTIENVSSILSGGILTTFILSFGMIGQYIGGHLSDRFQLSKLYLIFVSITLPLMGAMAFLENIELMVFTIFFSLFHFPCQPIENHLVSQLIPAKLVSSGYGIKFIFTFGLGSFATAFVGSIIEKYSLETVFPTLSLFLLLSVLVIGLMVFYDRTYTGQ